MTSYNQIIDIFSDFAAHHQQLQGHYFAIQEFIQATGAGDVIYPAMVVAPATTPVDISRKEVHYGFKIIFMDLVSEDDSNRNEVISDMLQIGIDFMSQMQLMAYGDKFTIDPSVTANVLNEKVNDVDYCTGWELNVSMRVDFLSDMCNVPSTLAPSEASLCQPVKIYLEDGTLLATINSGDNYVVEDVTITDSGGNILYTLQAGYTLTVSDCIIKKADGVTDLLRIKAEKTKTTTEVLAAMSGNETVADIITNGEPQKSIVARALDNRYTRVFNFIADGDDFRGIQMQHYGTIDSATLTNISTINYALNGSAVTIPFSHNRGDLLYLNVTRANDEEGGSVTISGYDLAETLPSVSSSATSDRYLCCVGAYDQKFKIFDLSIVKDNLNSHSEGLWGGNDPCIATLIPSSGGPYYTVTYSSVDKRWYAIATTQMAVLDADPNSATFATIISYIPITQLDTGSIATCYDPANDVIWVQVINGSKLLSLSRSGVRTNTNQSAGNNNSPPGMRYLPALGAIWLGGGYYDTINKKSISVVGNTLTTKSLGATLNRKNCYLYVCGYLRILIYKSWNLEYVATIVNNNCPAGDVCVDEGRNRLYVGGVFSTSAIAVIDTITNTTAGQITLANRDTNDWGVGDILYNQKYDLVISGPAHYDGGAVTSGNNRIHIIDPSTLVDKGYMTGCEQGDQSLCGLNRLALNRL